MRIGICVAIASASLRLSGVSRADTVYVSCEDAGEIAVLSSERATVVARWPVGKRPRGLRLAPDGRTLYVALSGSAKGGPGIDDAHLPPPDRDADGLGEITLTNGSATSPRVRLIASGADPESFDLSPDGKTAYVSNEDSATLSVVDLRGGRVLRRIPVGAEPEGVGLRPDGRRVYVTSEAAGLVSAVDLGPGADDSRVSAEITVPARPRALVFDRTGRTAYVSSENAATVSVLDLVGHSVRARIPIPREGVVGPLGPRPMGLALSRSGHRLYVTNGRGGTVSIIDTTAARVVSTIAGVGARPWGIALGRDERTLYTANGPSGDVTVIALAADGRSGTVRSRIAACAGPWGIAIGP